ncbi:COG4315 family predicted lipoprotein [Hydrogenophaga sp. NFH-34]|uniref:COG4315 family predicted lipoprotein n=1 Tax=Hydrogenophaga sp. NFH-34 TaxID=2744446 RepID=UPI001F3955E2|nr:hypothetical protein [Hydrogenophaga sp. NFH-34]
MRPLFLALTLSGTVLAACSTPASAPALASQDRLTGPNGMTLYTFDRDVAHSGKSVCNGPCATNWPPLLAQESDQARSGYTVITRDDGRKQWAYQGKPLYFWIKDAQPGDITGNGVNNLWRTARP